jgi:hypothetical protein
MGKFTLVKNAKLRRISMCETLLGASQQNGIEYSDNPINILLIKFVMK